MWGKSATWSRAEVWALFHAAALAGQSLEDTEQAVHNAAFAADLAITQFDRRFKSVDGGPWVQQPLQSEPEAAS